MQWLYGFHKFIILVSRTAIKLGAKAFTTSDYARHDIFTGHTKRIAAGNPYARLNDPRATTTGLVPLLGGLARTGLIVATPTGWRRTRPELRDLAAARLCVAGRLDAREGRYKAERDLWEWWQVGLEWLTTPRTTQATPPAHGTDCVHVRPTLGHLPPTRADQMAAPIIERPTRSCTPASPPPSTTGHRGQCEVEAESVAHVVAGILGLDTSAYSVGYVAGWLKGDADLIRQSASRVLAAAHRIAEAIIEDPTD